MSMKMCGHVGNFKSMIEQKEREIVTLCEQQILSLQKQIIDKDKELSKLLSKLVQLQDDFKYNLKLIDERDFELVQYDQEMAIVQASAKEVEKRLYEASKSLLDMESKFLEEKASKDEMKKEHKRIINDLQEQIKELRLEKNVDYQEKLGRLEAINIDLSQQLVEKQKKHDLESKEMAKQYQDEAQKQVLQAEVELDEIKKKLRTGDTQLKHLVLELEATITREKLQNELEEELRSHIRNKEEEIQKISLAFQKLQNEMESLKVKGDCESKCWNDKVKCIEGEYQIKIVQLKEQIESLLLKLEVSKAHLGSCENLKLQQLSAYVEKLQQIEKEMVHKENYFKKRLEEFETQAREAAEVHEQHEQESKGEVIRWKTKHDIVHSKYVSLQKELMTNLERERHLQENQSLPTSKKVYDGVLSRNMMPTSFGGEHNIGTSNSNLSEVTKVTTSPIISPTSPKGIPCSLQLDSINGAPRDRLEPRRTNQVELENRRLHVTVKDLKDENKRIRTIIGTMRAEMESLQKNAFQESLQNSASILKNENKNDEVKQLQEEMKFLKSRLTSMATSLQSIQDNTMESRQNPSAGTRPGFVNKSKVAEITNSETSLQAQLEAAVDDITRITHERDLLMELSNSLRADLNRELISTSDATLENNVTLMAQQDKNPLHLYDTDCSRCGHQNRPSCLVSNPGPQAELGGRQMTAEYHSLEAASSIQERLSEYHGNVGHVRANSSLQLEGNAFVHPCQQAQSKDIIHKGTASQRACYKASLKRRDEQKHGKPKIRNYNMKDDFQKSENG